LITPEIIEQIQEIILEDRRISAKLIAAQLDISRERVGSIIHEDLDIGKVSAKWVPKCLNADHKRQRCQPSEQLLEFFRRDPNDFLLRLGTMDETWLYHYDPETKQQSMEWRHSGSILPQKFRVQKSDVNVRVKNPLEKFSPRFFLGSGRHSPHLLSSKGPNYQSGVSRISAGAIERHFEGKTPREVHQGVLVLARQCPGSPGTCNTEQTGLPSNVLISHPTLRIWPRRTAICSMD